MSLDVYDKPATYLGTVKFVLFGEIAPVTVAHLTSACQDDSPDAVGVWYRGVKDFLIQGYLIVTKQPGTLNQDEITKQSHRRGSISLAKPGPGPDLTSSNSQYFQNFFALFSDSPFLDNQHLVFGHVVSGLDILQKIVKESSDEYFKSPPFIWKCYADKFTSKNSTSVEYASLLKEIPSQVSRSFEMLNQLIDSKTLSPIELYDAMYALVQITDSRRINSFEEIKARLIGISEYTGRAEPLCDLASRYHQQENVHQAFLQAKFCCETPYPTEAERILRASGKTDLADQLVYWYNVTRFDYLGIYAFPQGEYQIGHDALVQALKAVPSDVRLKKNLDAYKKLSSSVWPRKTGPIM